MKANYIIMSAMVAVLLLMTLYFRGIGRVGQGLKDGGQMLWTVFPLILLALAAAGLLQELVPAEAVKKYLGRENPYQGIFLAWLIGGVMPGAPYVTLPVAAVLLKEGAGIGAAATLVMSASLVGMTRIPYEIAFVGWQFSVLRVLACVLVAPVVGVLIHWLNVAFGFYAVG